MRRKESYKSVFCEMIRNSYSDILGVSNVMIDQPPIAAANIRSNYSYDVHF